MRALLGIALSFMNIGVADAEVLDYLAKMPIPRTIYMTPDIDTFPALYEGDRAGSFGAWSFALLSLAGLAALDAREHDGDSLVWIHSPGIVSYTIMLDDILARTGAARVDVPTVEDAVKLGLDKGWVKGYILYRAEASDRRVYDKIDLNDPAYNNSANVATNMAPDMAGIIVEERAEQVFRAMGLELLLDVRDRDERWCFENHKDRFSRRSLHLLDPKAPHMRDYAIATRSMCVFGVTPLVDEVLHWLEPNAPTLGWNAGDEHTFVAQLSRFAHFTTASNWIMNLPVMSCVAVGAHADWEELRVNRRAKTDPLLLDWVEDLHYTSFVLSDGDNVQWFLGNFINHPDAYWQAENRGAFPFGWTMPVDHLSQVGVPLLAHLARTASPNDQMLSFPGGYYYPDRYGQGRGSGTDWYAGRVAMFGERFAKLGARVVINIAEDWLGEGAMHGYACFARQIPELVGVLAMQYHPYNAGRGDLRWVEDKRGRPIPVLSPRFAIWSGLSRVPGNGTPALVAGMINEQPHAGLPDGLEHFDWTIVHAWSPFQRADATSDPLAEEVEQRRPRLQQDGAVVRNAYEPTLWCVKRLEPHVRVVAPEELLWRIRIQFKPRETLDALAEDLMENPDTPPYQRALLVEYRAKLVKADFDTPEAIRAAYRWLQDIYLAKVIRMGEMPEAIHKE